MFYLEGRTLSSFEPAQQSRYQFFTSQKNKLSSQNSVASPPSFHIMNHSGKAECFEHGNHVPIRHKTEHVVIHKTKAKEFQFYTLLTSSSQNSRNFRRRSLARRSSTAISCGICFIMRKSSFFLPSQPSQMDGAKITCFIQFWNKQTDGEHQRALLPSETRNFNFACLHAGADWALSFLTSIFFAHHSQLFMCRSLLGKFLFLWKLSHLGEEVGSNNVWFVTWGTFGVYRNTSCHLLWRISFVLNSPILEIKNPIRNVSETVFLLKIRPELFSDRTFFFRG